MVGPPLETATFTAAGATQKRRLDAYHGDIVNVKDYGAIGGDGTVDDTVNIQKAIDAAFGGPTNPVPGGSLTPHGLATYKNRGLFFPSGAYLISNPLVLTSVKRGHIFGAMSTQFFYASGAVNKTLFRVNGMEDTLLENFSNHFIGSSTGCIGFDLDWDGVTTSGVGLSHNWFRKVSVGGPGPGGAGINTNGTRITTPTHGCIGWKIAGQGHGGAGNTFWNCVGEQLGIGWHIIGADATNQTYQALCGGSENGICWQVDGGSIGIINGISNAGTNCQLDVQINNASTINIAGLRSEASWFLELNAVGAIGIIAAGFCGSGGHGFDPKGITPQNNIRMAPGSQLLMDAFYTFAVVSTNPAGTPKPTVMKRGGPFTALSWTAGTGFFPNASDFNLPQNI